MAAWDVLEKSANVAHLFAVLVALFTSLLRVQRSNRRQCAELERCTRRLRSLLQWPPAGSGSGAAMLCSEIGGPVIMALGNAARLVDSHNKSTLWRRIRSGGRTATELRDMQDIIDSYCRLLLFVNAHFILAAHCYHPISPSSRTVPEVNDTSQSPSGQAVTGTPDTERANDVGQGSIDDDQAAWEGNVPALLPIDFSCITVHVGDCSH